MLARSPRRSRSPTTPRDAYSATGGIGWSFPLSAELVLRPIFNFSRVESRVSASGQTESGEEIDFLRDGRLDTYGLGGSLVLDYERDRPEHTIDVELRLLGFNHLSSVGFGLELDSSAQDILVERTRLMARYKFGDRVSGWAVGIAVGF